ncbi:MAG: DUF3108 domain-containing protein [Bdellovibrionales bacterium]|nr:DUF3108 domain-containing protein [Bdellovibrionales bacterium]
MLLCCLLVIACLVPARILADNYIPPQTLEVQTPSYKADFTFFQQSLGQYRYRVSWGGIGAGYITVNILQFDKKFVVSTEVRTNSFVDIFYKLRYQAMGALSTQTLLPDKTEVVYRENSREKRAGLLFRSDGKVQTFYWRKGHNAEELTFDPKNMMLDPFSAAFLARSLPWDDNVRRTFDTFNGKSRYLISLESIGEDVVRVNGIERPVWVISPTVEKLTEKQEGTKPKLREAKIFLTKDAAREIVKIESEVFVGTVVTELTKFTPISKVTQAKLLESEQFLKMADLSFSSQHS